MAQCLLLTFDVNECIYLFGEGQKQKPKMLSLAFPKRSLSASPALEAEVISPTALAHCTLTWHGKRSLGSGLHRTKRWAALAFSLQLPGWACERSTAIFCKAELLPLTNATTRWHQGDREATQLCQRASDSGKNNPNRHNLFTVLQFHQHKDRTFE